MSACPAPVAAEDERFFAALAHVSVFVTTVFGPLLVLALRGRRSAFVRYHCIQAIAYQAVLLGLIALLTLATFGAGSVIAMPLALVAPIPVAYAAVQAWRGRWDGFPVIDELLPPR